MDLRHLTERGPRGGEGVGDRREPPRQRPQPVRQRRVVPGQQHVERLAGVGEQRVPGVLAQLFDLEQAARHVVAEHCRVDAGLLVKSGVVDGGQPGRELIQAPALGVERRRAAVGKLVVEAVVAKFGGDVGTAVRQVVEVILG